MAPVSHSPRYGGRIRWYRERKHAVNYNEQQNKFIFKTAVSILMISNHNSFRVLSDENCFRIYFIWKVYLYFSLASPRNQHCANCIGTLSFPIMKITSRAGQWLRAPPQLTDMTAVHGVCLSVCHMLWVSHSSSCAVVASTASADWYDCSARCTSSLMNLATWQTHAQTTILSWK